MRGMPGNSDAKRPRISHGAAAIRKTRWGMARVALAHGGCVGRADCGSGREPALAGDEAYQNPVPVTPAEISRAADTSTGYGQSSDSRTTKESARPHKTPG